MFIKTFNRILKYFWRFFYNCSSTKDLCRFIRVQKPIVKYLGPDQKRSQEHIEIIITYACSLKCFNCAAACRHAPSDIHMTIEQTERFIKESIDNKIRWKHININGGEPTLNPYFFEILDLLLKYRNNFSHNTLLRLFTNGFGKKCNDILSKVPPEIEVCNTLKKSNKHDFIAYNNAPKDRLLYKFANYSCGCWVTGYCGIGLTPFGYYPCLPGASIDRVFGFDIGRKKIPHKDDFLIDQLKTLCQYCGFFQGLRTYNRENISSSWKDAYYKYKMKKPKLTLY